MSLFLFKKIIQSAFSGSRRDHALLIRRPVAENRRSDCAEVDGIDCSLSVCMAPYTAAPAAWAVGVMSPTRQSTLATYCRLYLQPEQLLFCRPCCLDTSAVLERLTLFGVELVCDCLNTDGCLLRIWPRRLLVMPPETLSSFHFTLVEDSFSKCVHMSDLFLSADISRVKSI